MNKKIIIAMMLALMFSSVQAAVVSNTITQAVGTPAEIIPAPPTTESTTGTSTASGGRAGGGSRPADVACNRQVYPYSGFLCSASEECAGGIAYAPLREVDGFCCNIKCTPVPKTSENPETQPTPLPAEVAREYHPECDDGNPCTHNIWDGELNACYVEGKTPTLCYVNGERGECKQTNKQFPECVVNTRKFSQEIFPTSLNDFIGWVMSIIVLLAFGFWFWLEYKNRKEIKKRAIKCEI